MGSSSSAESVEKSETTIEQTVSVTDESWTYTDNSKSFVDQSVVDNSKKYFDDSVLDQSQSTLVDVVTDSNIKNSVYVDQSQKAVANSEVLSIGSGNYMKSTHDYTFQGTREGSSFLESNPILGSIFGPTTASQISSQNDMDFGTSESQKGSTDFGYTGSKDISSQQAGQTANPVTEQISSASAISSAGLGSGTLSGTFSGGVSSFGSIFIVILIVGGIGVVLFLLLRKKK